jgi:hypothetical protein
VRQQVGDCDFRRRLWHGIGDGGGYTERTDRSAKEDQDESCESHTLTVKVSDAAEPPSLHRLVSISTFALHEVAASGE